MKASPTAKLVVAAVAEAFGTVTAEEIFARNRTRTVVAARSVAMWILYRHFGMSATEVGRQFQGYRWREGRWQESPFGKDHVTTMTAVRRVDADERALRLAKSIVATLANLRSMAPPAVFPEAMGAE